MRDRFEFFGSSYFVHVRSWAVLAGVVFLLSPGPVHAQTILERILQKVSVSGLFVNAAQSGTLSSPARIDASITTIFVSNTPSDAMIQAWSPPSLELGNLTALALGATNAGEQILGLSAAVARSEQQNIDVLPDTMGAMTILLGGNSTLQHQVDIARIDDLIALSMQTEYTYGLSGSEPDTTVLALNMAANTGDVTARVLNHVEAAKTSVADITTTAIGSVNAGVSKIIGAR